MNYSMGQISHLMTCSIRDDLAWAEIHLKKHQIMHANSSHQIFHKGILR